MKLTLNIETNDPADLERIAAALAGKDTAAPAARPSQTRAAKTETAPSTENPARGAATAQAETAAAASHSDVPATVPGDGDLVSAANVAVAKVGAGGADKVKKYIAEKFTKADGSPGNLKGTADNQKAELLDQLQKIGRGEIKL